VVATATRGRGTVIGTNRRRFFFYRAVFYIWPPFTVIRRDVDATAKRRFGLRDSVFVRWTGTAPAINASRARNFGPTDAP